MRLGFALATAVEPGILLMDEGISAGDARFTERQSTMFIGTADEHEIVWGDGHLSGAVGWHSSGIGFCAPCAPWDG